MQAALKDKNDIKIFILYLMRNVGYPLEYENLNDIVIQDGVVGYFDFVECFGELLDTGNVREIKGENGDLYEITEQGKHVSDSLEGNLLGLIRDKSLKSALRLLSFKKPSGLACLPFPVKGFCIIIREIKKSVQRFPKLPSGKQKEDRRSGLLFVPDRSRIFYNIAFSK